MQANGAALGELDGVVGVVEQRLTQPRRIAQQAARQYSRLDAQGEVFVARRPGQYFGDFIHQARQHERCLLKHQFARLDLG